MWQARWVQGQLQQHHPQLDVVLERIRTEGDIRGSEPLSRLGGTGLFTKELERALLDGRIDAAVHSLKDLPTVLPEGLHLGAIPVRADPRDALIGPRAGRIADLPEGAKVGTGSPRRVALLLHQRADLRTGSVRGNLDTRLEKLRRGEWDALVLAMAGLTRLELGTDQVHPLPPEEFTPAVGQGALGVEIRQDDDETASLVAVLDDGATRRAVAAERALMRGLGSGCQLPVGALGGVSVEGLVTLRAFAGARDGSEVLREEGEDRDPKALGQELAERLLARGAADLIA